MQSKAFPFPKLVRGHSRRQPRIPFSPASELIEGESVTCLFLFFNLFGADMLPWLRIS